MIKIKNRLTPKEFLALPLSQAIRKVAEDVKSLHKAGIEINMDGWWKEGKHSTYPCSVCLGGAALCSFAPESVNGHGVYQYGEMMGIEHDCVNKIIQTFDEIRLGHYDIAFTEWYRTRQEMGLDRLCGNTYIVEFEGKLGYFSRRLLIHKMRKLAKLLEDRGY